MIKITSEEQLNKFPWQVNEALGSNEPNAMELFKSGVQLYYDGYYLFYKDEKDESVILLVGKFNL